MTEPKKHKIAIVGAHCGRAAIEELVKAIDKDKLEVIMINVDEVAKREEAIRLMGPPLPIKSIEMYKLPELTETRAERRVKARKKNRR